MDVGRVCPRRWPFFDAALRAPSRARECPRFDVDRLGHRSCLLLASATFSRNCDAAFNSRDDLTAVTWTLRQRNAEISQLNLMHKGNAMPTLRIVLAIAILGALPAVCSERQPIQCDAQCVEGVKNRTRSYKIFLGARDEEWQTAFAGANGELAQGDWSQRLSEIQQEYCGTPGKVNYKKVGAMEMAMAKRLALERGDVMASFRNDPESTSAIKHSRVRERRIEIPSTSCSAAKGEGQVRALVFLSPLPELANQLAPLTESVGRVSARSWLE